MTKLIPKNKLSDGSFIKTWVRIETSDDTTDNHVILAEVKTDKGDTCLVSMGKGVIGR